MVATVAMVGADLGVAETGHAEIAGIATDGEVAGAVTEIGAETEAATAAVGAAVPAAVAATTEETATTGAPPAVDQAGVVAVGLDLSPPSPALLPSLPEFAVVRFQCSALVSRPGQVWPLPT